MNASLRPATAADVPRVAGVLIDTRAAFMPYAPLAHTPGEVRSWVAGHLIPSGDVTVAEVNNQVVGVAALEVKAGVSWVTQMAVDPAFVGRGIGGVLLAHVMRTLPAPLRLYTFQANYGARRFYERHGFVAIEFADGQANEERCPDVLYEHRPPSSRA